MLQIIISFINTNIIQLVTFIISLLAIFFSIYGWHKSRVIYGIDTIIFDPKKEDSKNYINKKLYSGKYIMLSMVETEDIANVGIDIYDDNVMCPGSIISFQKHETKNYRIILGRVKK